MREVYGIHYNSYLTNAGEFLSSLIQKHSCFKESKTLLTTHTLLDDHNFLDENHVTTIIIPYIHQSFRDQMIKSWEHLKGYESRHAVYEFNRQYRMLNDYIYDCGHKHGNPYKDFRDERLNRNLSTINLEFIDIGKILRYNDFEYNKLVKALKCTPIVEGDMFCCKTWYEYVNQYINNKLIIDRHL